MKTRKLFPLLLALLLFCAPACRGLRQRGVQSQNDALVGFNEAAWAKLGERRVLLSAERDTIPVTLLKGRYRKIMLVVHGSALEMYDVVVTFANGDRYTPATRLYFAEDTRSRVIDLPGTKRTIKKVDFFYRSKHALTGFAEVELWGRR